MICHMKELLQDADVNHKAVGAFNVSNMEMIMGAVKAAEESNTPIILQIAEARLKHSPLAYIGPMMVQAAREAKVKIAVHLDHGSTLDTLREALSYGFTSIMFDGSSYSLEENIKRTNQVIELAKKYNVTIEAELGIVGGKEGGNIQHKVKYTDSEEAKRFVQATGVDALAVAIGNVHGHYVGKPQLNFTVLKEIAEKVDTPLVLHGGSGISAVEFRKCIDFGVKKINIGTASFDALTESAEKYLKTEGQHNYFTLNEEMVQGVYENVKECIYIFNNKGELTCNM